MNGFRPLMSGPLPIPSNPLASPSGPSPPAPPHHPSSLSLGLLPLPPTRLPLPDAEHAAVARVRFADIMPYEGAPAGAYMRAVEALAGSLMRCNAVVIELGGEDSAVVRCALESVRMFFKARAQCGSWGKPGRGVYTYRAGRVLEDGDLSPPCMSEAFRCLGKAARAALCAIAKHLRLRSDVFNNLLDDMPLPPNEVSSSVLVAAYSQGSAQIGKGSLGGGKSSNEVEKGLLTLIASDSPGIQVYDPNGQWYLADSGLNPGDLLLFTGRALSHATAGLRPAASYRTAYESSVGIVTGGRASLTFRLMPQSNAVLDCSPIAAAGHVIPQSYQPISVSQFMDDLSAEEDFVGNHLDSTYETRNSLVAEPSLRSVLSDPISGAFLEDAMVVSCGHSFGGDMLKKVLEMNFKKDFVFLVMGLSKFPRRNLLCYLKILTFVARCTLCNAEIETASLIPNFALRAAATAVKNEDDRRLFHNAALRKRRKELGEQIDMLKRLGKENGAMAADSDNLKQQRGVQYPFAAGERVLIKGNRRTPDKFVGREAMITSQCLNGWYLLKTLDTGESVRLQYRSLQKTLSLQADNRKQPQQLLQTGS